MENKNMYDIQKKIVELIGNGAIQPFDGKIMLLNCEAGYFQAMNEIEDFMKTENRTIEDIQELIKLMRTICKVRTAAIMQEKYETLKNVINGDLEAETGQDGTSTPEKQKDASKGHKNRK